MTDPEEEKPDDHLRNDWFENAAHRVLGSFFRPGKKERPEPAPGLEQGKVVGDFRLVSMIGQGGMGQVWEAEQISLGGRKIAVKFIRPDRVTEKQSAYFEREARAGGRLSHPGIVSIHGYGKSDGLAWIAMELVEGTWTLRDFLDELVRENDVLPDYDRHVARFVRDLATAMHAAHEGGVIHRDLKPQNVLITPDNRPKVTDFGLARITDESALSATGDFAGTYFYMSPEQVVARRMGIDHRTDIFSLGVLLYEMLAWVRPFQGDTGHQVAAQIVTKDPPDPRTIRSRIPRDLAVIAGKALEKDRDRRFATMLELADDLERFLSDEPILAKPPTQIQRVLKWCARNPARSLAGAVAAAAFVIIAFLLVRIAGQKGELEVRAEQAQKSADEARSYAEQAEANALAEKKRSDEVLRLSLSQDCEDLMAEAGKLWPAYPDKIEEYEAWIAEAKALVGQLDALRAKRQELRRDAIPRTERERRLEREGHPDFEKLESLSARIESRRKALAVRRGEAEPELPLVNWSEYPKDASDLNGMAWPLVEPERVVFGREALGLVLAERAAEVALPAEQATIWDTVAWGRLALGLVEGALEAGRSALEAASEEEKEEFGEYLGRIEAAAESVGGETALPEAEAQTARLQEERDALEVRVDERREWSFPEEMANSRWWNNQLTKLIDELESLRAPGTGLLTEDGVSAEWGWSISRRLAFARRLREAFAEGGEFAARWDEALPAIEATYPGLDISVQMGLVPIGPDPNSELWELWHVQSGEEPQRGGDGKLLLEEASGLVFVLLPGGGFWMGAQSTDPTGRNYDRIARPEESPVHEVELSAFFLSKYEMTQGQWKRLLGANPSRYGPDGLYSPGWNVAREPGTLLEPVEEVSWNDCMGLLSKMGLALPSEAQWEYGARGGTDTPWWSGVEEESLQGAANLADRYGRDNGGSGWSQFCEWLDDGYTVHAPVDSLQANLFGLHHVHGNVWEWCLDGYDAGFYRARSERDPVNPPEASLARVARGGSCDRVAGAGRSALRGGNAPSDTGKALGLRPARALQP